MTQKNVKCKNDRLNKISIFFSISCAFIIIIAKIFGWLVTNSQSMFASLTDSALDIISSIVNMVALYYSSTPIDRYHRFGREKAEDLAVFFQAAFFTVSGLFVIFNSLYVIFYPKQITNINEGILIGIFSIIITSILITFQSYVHKRTNSNIVKADMIHYSVDIGNNIGLIISLYSTMKYKLLHIDSIFAIFFAIMMLRAASKLISRAFANLMDKEFDEEKKKKLIEIVKSFPDILGLHDIRTRQAGSKLFIQFHIELDGELKLSYVHNISENILIELGKIFPKADIIIHQDPYGIEENIKFPFDKEIL